MAIICPTITAFDTDEYRRQMDTVTPFAKRIHIDLMDGVFAPTKSPDLHHIWWPHQLEADIHLMYQNPMDYIAQLIKLHPRRVIIHNEATVHHMHFAAQLHAHGIEVGLAVLHDTPIEYAYQIMHAFDHVLVFSGKLGYHGGEADLGLLGKVQKIRDHHPEVEIGWDGGISDQNAEQLIAAGVDALNVGGFIQKSSQPAESFEKLVQLAL
jgi:ribulose-phosphate 3-epimerase